MDGKAIKMFQDFYSAGLEKCWGLYIEVCIWIGELCLLLGKAGLFRNFILGNTLTAKPENLLVVVVLLNPGSNVRKLKCLSQL